MASPIGDEDLPSAQPSESNNDHEQHKPPVLKSHRLAKGLRTLRVTMARTGLRSALGLVDEGRHYGELTDTQVLRSYESMPVDGAVYGGMQVQ